MSLTIDNAPDELRFSGRDGRLLSDAELQAVIDAILECEREVAD